MPHIDKIRSFILQLAYGLLVFVRNPEMVILRIKIRQIRKLFKMTAYGAHKGQVDFRLCHCKRNGFGFILITLDRIYRIIWIFILGGIGMC